MENLSSLLSANVLPNIKNQANNNVIQYVQNIKKTNFNCRKIDIFKFFLTIVSGILIIGSAVAGVIGYIATRDKRNLEKRFAQNLQIYLDAAKDGKLTVEILDNLINSLDELSNDDTSKAVNLKITPSQFSDLIQNIFDYTVCLAEANNISPTLISKPKILKKKNYSDLQYYLNMQKNIFEQVA